MKLIGLMICLTMVACEPATKSLAKRLPLSDPNLGANDIRKMVSGTQHTCVLLNGGSVFCWGDSAETQLGEDEEGTRIKARTPQKIVGIQNAVDIAAGETHTCAVTHTGAVSCWGSDGAHRGTWEVDLKGALRIAAGEGTTCALADGIYCWGKNVAGQVPGSPDERVREPFKISEIPAKKIIANQRVFAAETATGWVAWGANEHGVIGDGKGIRPMKVHGDSALVVSDQFACASSDSEVTCWGELGTVSPTAEPSMKDREQTKSGTRVVGGLKSVDEIAIGSQHGCGLTEGKIYCWGNNRSGQLGDGTTKGRPDASLTKLETEVNYLTTGNSFTCAGSLREIWCWGNNDFGQVGDGARVNRWEPVKVDLPL